MDGRRAGVRSLFSKRAVVFVYAVFGGVWQVYLPQLDDTHEWVYFFNQSVVTTTG